MGPTAGHHCFQTHAAREACRDGWAVSICPWGTEGIGECQGLCRACRKIVDLFVAMSLVARAVLSGRVQRSIDETTRKRTAIGQDKVLGPPLWYLDRRHRAVAGSILGLWSSGHPPRWTPGNHCGYRVYRDFIRAWPGLTSTSSPGTGQRTRFK